MTNTLISYQYRDGSNYKSLGLSILSGHLDEAGKTALRASFNEADSEMPSFIPGQVGLPDLQDSFAGPSGWDPQSDHPWHELLDITDTPQAADVEMTVQDFARAMSTVKFDETYLPPFYEQMSRRHEAASANDEDPSPSP